MVQRIYGTCTGYSHWNIYSWSIYKSANTFGAVLAFIAASAVMIFIKYGMPVVAPDVTISIWSYSIISIAVSLVVGIPASFLWRKAKGDDSQPDPNTTIYNK